MSSASKVTAHVLELTLVTASVGLSNSFQFAAVLYGSALNTYVLLSLVTIQMSHCSAEVREVKSEALVTVNVSVKATHGNTLVFNFQLESNTGTLPLEVHVSHAAAVPMSHGCTAVAHALAHALNVDNATLQSLISFHVVWSNTATFQSTAEDGHTTSHVLEVYPLGLLES